ncbi:hypothetical protein D3C77_264420 [compost metagenome]
MRGVLFALRRLVGLYRRGPCQVGILSLLLPVLPVAGDRQCRRGHFRRGLHDCVPALVGQRCDGAVHWHGRAHLVDHRRQFRWPGDYRQDRSDHGLGRDHSGRRFKRDRLVLVRPRGLHSSLEPQPAAHLGGYRQDHSPDPVGVSGHGIGGSGFRCGGKPQAQRTPRLPVRHPGCSRRLCAVDHGYPGHRAQSGAGQCLGAVCPGLREDIQPGGGQHHHGAGGNGLCRLAVGLAVHPGPNSENDR